MFCTEQQLMSRNCSQHRAFYQMGTMVYIAFIFLPLLPNLGEDRRAKLQWPGSGGLSSPRTSLLHQGLTRTLVETCIPISTFSE